MGRKTIAIFGGRHPRPGDLEYEQAMALGSLLAACGYDVMSGGYSGVMEAVSLGAAQAGGTSIGVTMEIFDKLPPNPFLTREIRTRDFFERLEVLSSKADAFIALRGGMGTLTEVGLIWNMLQTRVMRQKPVILLGECWKPLLQAVSEHLVVSSEDLSLLQYARTAEDAVALLALLAEA